MIRIWSLGQEHLKEKENDQNLEYQNRHHLPE